MRTGRSWSMSSRRRARATRRPKPPPTNITASASSMSSPARRTKAAGERAELHQCLRRSADRGSRARTTKIVAITAAMPSGTGLDLLRRGFPERCFDVGIAEQHAVTFAAGLAAEGFKPFAAIYSTFLQRAYDQVVHDVAIQKLPVRFAIDRAGLVGADGPTHAGSFDVAYLCLPARLGGHGRCRRGRADAHGRDGRGDRRCAVGVPLSARGGDRRRAAEARQPLPIGKGRIVARRLSGGATVFGARLAECLMAADQLAGFGLSATVADARFAKPLDMDSDSPIGRATTRC